MEDLDEKEKASSHIHWKECSKRVSLRKPNQRFGSSLNFALAKYKIWMWKRETPSHMHSKE